MCICIFLWLTVSLPFQIWVNYHFANCNYIGSCLMIMLCTTEPILIKISYIYISFPVCHVTAYVLWIIILFYCFYYVAGYCSHGPTAFIHLTVFRSWFKIPFILFGQYFLTEWYFHLSVHHPSYSSKPDCILLQKKDVFNKTLPRRWLLICLWKAAVLLMYHWGLK